MSTARSIIVIVALAVLFPNASSRTIEAAQHAGHADSVPPSFVEAVRQATDAYRDVRNVPPGYAPALGCVSGPEAGAMGVHFVNGAQLENDTFDLREPEALIYEFKDGAARLVGVEFIVLADVWHQNHPANETPILEGQLLHFVESPNRFGLPAFYEIHVWAWRNNPNGAFADWNLKVSCEGQ